MYLKKGLTDTTPVSCGEVYFLDLEAFGFCPSAIHPEEKSCKVLCLTPPRPGMKSQKDVSGGEPSEAFLKFLMSILKEPGFTCLLVELEGGADCVKGTPGVLVS